MSTGASELVRRTISFSGRVQGVGFRYTVRATAARFIVTGYVRNLADGRVELVAEGTAAELDRFQEAVADTMRGYIRDTTTTECQAAGEFTSFTIAR